MAGSPFERYKKLEIGESLPHVSRYPIACRELSSILRGAYSKLPKNLQSLIFQDTLAAFRLLPQMQRQYAASTANLLFQSAEAVLPKQKRVLAVTEFKHAKVAYKRHFRDRQEEGPTHLPQDVLVRIFSYLDLQSLFSAASVCWLWNLAASDNCLWRLQYALYFGNFSNCLTSRELWSGALEIDECLQLHKEDETETVTDWRDAFKKAYKGNSLNLACHRGYCGYCKTVVWLSNMKCSAKHSRFDSRNQQIKPMSQEKIVEYILDGTLSMLSSSDSDSDSDSDEATSRLWAFPRYPVGCEK
ncbi:hypothetical protein NMG60_11020243 [Bertholletia excelsa]